MPEVPCDFSIMAAPYFVPCQVIAEIDAFLQIFERVTTNRRWQYFNRLRAADRPDSPLRSLFLHGMGFPIAARARMAMDRM